VDFMPTDDQNAFRAATADFLAAARPSNLADLLDHGPDRKQHEQAAELGWFALGVADEHGGVGGSTVEEMLLFRELGRALLPGPFLATVLAGRVAIAAGESGLAEELFAGHLTVALAEPDPAHGDGVHLVFDHDGADLVLTVGAESAVLADAATGLDAVTCIDPLTDMARGRLDGAVRASAPADPINQLGWTLLAAQSTGIAEATRDMAVAYLKVREQFGRPIGSFQALKHRAADMAVDCEAAYAVTAYAALAMHEGDVNTRLYTMSARVVAGDAADRNTRANIQLHGGMGTTFEHDAHFYLKRAHVLSQWLGGRKGPLRALVDEPSPLLVGTTS
jgi:alkylation response protein AidB-like acyl-CoA dehydrogenase